MNLVEFLTKQRPICDSFPLYEAFSGNYPLYIDLKDRSIADFGEDLFTKRCANRFFCATSCVGRPIPRYPELEPFLANINSFEEGLYRGKPVWFVKVVSCSACPIKDTCTALCGSIVSYMGKHEQEEPIFESRMISTEALGEQQLSNALEVASDMDLDKVDTSLAASIPWDCLSRSQHYIIQAKFYTVKSERQIASELNIHVRAVQKMTLTAIAKLKQFSKAREILKDNNTNKIAEMYYIKCFTQQEIAQLTDTSTPTVNRKLKEFDDLHKL